MAQRDGHRVYPVDYLVMHHSTGPEFANAEDIEVQDWYDRIGKMRGYAGKARSFHDHPSRNKETFAQAQLTLRRYTKDGNKYGWRLTELIKDPWNNVAWHAANWPINQRSMGIETCGNYMQQKLPEKALMLVADYFREHDKKIGGKLQVTGHKQYIATACPGQIFDQLKIIIDMINNPEEWNEKLWPTPKPDPVMTPVEPPKQDLPINPPKMEQPKVTRKSVGEHVKSAASYAAPVQTVTAAFGVIFSFNNPDMPVEVVFAYAGLFGFAFNLMYAGGIKLMDRLEKKA
jgi:hypothetical protein